jgi:hypothetical protein
MIEKESANDAALMVIQQLSLLTVFIV